ncbi:trypsin-like serine protease [Kitasatospora sp. NPDC059722]|uniref:trypsin-like serine protease n=1 Tax=Kitasatospora sp. NPDC059722 TaxID=3346925 RepID=UPI0036AF1B3B
MKNHARIRGLAAASTALVLATVAGWTTAGAATGDTAPPAPADLPKTSAETFAYPNADQILALRGITVTRGDGGITVTDCGKAGSFQIKVNAVTKPANNDDMICFAAPGASGYLALTIPEAYRITTYGRSVQASLSTDQKPAETVSVAADTTKGIGESIDPKTRAVLLELRVTGSSATPPAPQPTDPSLAYTAKINIGNGKRACSATLVDRNWLLTAASCFTDTPDDLTTVTAGAPKDKTTATIGRTDLTNTGTGAVVDVVELAPRADRDLVMARLAFPVTGITPVTLGATAPVAAENLRAAGYGRTVTDWVPTKVHTTTHTVGAVAATTVDTAPADGQTPICQGDAGAPLLRDKNGTTELAAIASRSWQGGCLGALGTELRTGATSVRTDDLGAWVKQVREAALSTSAPTTSGVYDPVKQTSTEFTVDDKGRVMGAYNINGQGWSSWTSISDRPAGVKPFVGSPTALYNPATNAIELFAMDTDGLIWQTYYMADAQGWRPWAGTGSTSFTGSATAVYNPSTKTAEVFATTADGPVAHMYYTPGMTGWSTWSNINADYRFTGSPRALYNPATDALELFAIGRDNTMYHTYWFNDGKPWSPWLQLNQNTFTGSPSLVYNPSTKTAEVFATNTDGVVAHAYYTAGTAGWSSWTTINGDQPFTSSPSVLYNPATDALELFAVRSDKSLAHTYWFNNGKPWNAWESLSGTTKLAAGRIPAPLFSASSSTVDLFGATAPDGTVNHTSYKPGMPSWAPLDTLSGITLPGIALPTS